MSAPSKQRKAYKHHILKGGIAMLKRILVAIRKVLCGLACHVLGRVVFA